MLTEPLLASATTAARLPVFFGQVFFGIVRLEDLLGVLITTLAFTVFGLIAFAVAYFIILKATPFSIRKEIEEDQNVALGVVIGAVIIGIALIIAAAIQG